MSKVLFRTALLLAALGLLFILLAPRLQTERITEDDPRWDCHTMGNRVCGVQK